MNTIKLLEKAKIGAELSDAAISKINDKELLENAEFYGKKLLYWRYKFIGLLAEINKRRLYEKKNCCSIFEFAAKFGGLSEEQVRRARNLDKRFEELPKLKELLTT